MRSRFDSLFAARENIRFATGALTGHKLRSALTIIGIVIGVTTVIAMVSIIEGFNNNVVKNFQSFGATLVQFQKYDVQFGPGRRDPNERTRKNLTYEDAVALKALCPSMLAVSPERYWFARSRRRSWTRSKRCGTSRARRVTRYPTLRSAAAYCVTRQPPHGYPARLQRGRRKMRLPSARISARE